MYKFKIAVKKIFCVPLLFVALSFNCKAEVSNPASDLPENMPSDFAISYNSHGGMLQISQQLYISKDSCFFEKNKYGNEVILKFSITEKELDDIYRTVKENNFDDIETFQKKVYDRGGESVSIYFNKEKITKSNSGLNFVEKEWQKEFDAIVNMLTAITKKVWDQNSREFTIKVMKNVKDKDGYIIFDDEQIYKGDDEFDFNKKLDESGFYELKLKLIDGKYSMNYNHMGNYGLRPVDITGYSELIIDSRDGEIKYELH